MRNAKLLLLGAILGSLGLWASGRRSEAVRLEGLPGAKPVIDARTFSTLHEAFAAVSRSGGELRLPPGEFHIHHPLIISGEDVSVVGAGSGTHIVNDNEKKEPAILLAHPEAKRSGGDDRKPNRWRIRLANFRVTGNPKSGHGVEARYINEILIDGVTVSEHGGDGVRLDYCYEDPRVCDSLITYNKGTGLNLIGCHDIVVSSNQFEENQDALRCSDGFNLTMSGNNLDDHLGRGVVIENTYGSVVAANMIEECAGEAIVLDRDCYGITLSANVIAHNGGGVDLRDAHGCAVSANTFTLMKTHAIRVGPDSARIAIGGNSFCDSYIGAGAQRRKVDDQQAGGLLLDGGKHVGVTGNVFSGLTPHAVANVDAKQVLFAGNVLVDVSSQHEEFTESLVDGNLISPQDEAKPKEKRD